MPPKTIYIDDIVDVTNIRHVNDHVRNTTDISDVTNITNIYDERTNITNIHDTIDVKKLVSLL